MGKPGHWIGGSTHGNEYTGTEVALMLIDRLVSGYGTDPEITRLVDTRTFYVCPVINPDGHFNSLEKGISQRANSMLRDDDGDGKINEDGPDDLDGDGVIAQFRYKDPKGQFVVDESDPRLMIRLRANEQTTRTRYSVVAEDRDNDGDGKRGEDSEAGIDINRNFPERWWRDDGTPGGTGAYPTSSPEVRAVAEFFHTHPNLLMAQFFHTSGGFTYRPLGSAPQSQIHPKDLAVFDFVMGKKYLEINGEEVPAAWLKPESIPALRAELRKTSKNKYAIERGYEFPRAWKVSYDELADRTYGFGLSTDWDYLQLGIYSLTTELWNPEIDIPGFPRAAAGQGDRNARARALLKCPGRVVRRPAVRRVASLRAPGAGRGRARRLESQIHEQRLAGRYPRGRRRSARPVRVVPRGADAQPGHYVGHGPDGVRQSVGPPGVGGAAERRRCGHEGRGGGQLPCARGQGRHREHRAAGHSHGRGADLRGNRQDVVWLIGDRDRVKFLQGTPWQRLGVIDGAMAVPGYTAGAGAPATPRGGAARSSSGRRGSAGSWPDDARQSGAKREVTWLVAVTGDAPLRIAVSSQKGGTTVATVKIQ